MLGWMGDQTDQVADDSRVLEPPETPAPVFALRAFQSALFGTPRADEEDNTKIHITDKPQSESQHPSGLSSLGCFTEHKGDATKTMKADIDMAVNASPTKSILVTPGTASNRRKTVSFGDSVVDNERKREDSSGKSLKTPVNLSGNISSQWSSSSSDGKSKPRSKLTQALMDSREKTRSSEQFFHKPDEPRPAASAEPDDNEDTINMEEPRSQSGKYWKAEFDSYRSRTALEIKRLIQYRSAAKTYAKKKDEEASRLATKLKEEELRVAEMERHVTQLASTMVSESTRADKEQLVQELAKQTALALQNKHKVSLLRKVLEEHGVVSSEVEDIVAQPDVNASSKQTSQALRKAQHALNQANARIAEMKQKQSDFDKLKDLALSSEQKASELEKENAMLKQTLARAKQEMSKYEGRRKEKEAKLKQREAKLETRNQEYRERLKQQREQEDNLKESFSEERRHMQEQIDLLRLKLKAIESVADARAPNRHHLDSRKSYSGVQIHDFGQLSPHRLDNDETEETEQPPSPSPRAKDRRSYVAKNEQPELELRRALQEMGIENNDEKFPNILGISPLKTLYQEEDNTVPPSSPPEIPSIETGTWSGAIHKRHVDDRFSRLASHAAVASLPSRRLGRDDSHQIRTERLRTRRSPTKYSLDALSTLSDAYLLDRARKRQTLTTFQPDSLPVERKIAAQARLRRKDETRKGRQEGKENIRTSVKN